MRRAAIVLGVVLASMAVAAPFAQARGIEGRWTIDVRGADQVQLNLRRSWNRAGSRGIWSNTTDVSRSDLRGLPGRGGSGPVSLQLVREAGIIHLEGRMDGGHGGGTFTFDPDPGFVADLKRAGFREITDEDLVRLSINGLGRDYIHDLSSLGLRETSLESLLRLHANDVQPDFVRALTACGYDELDAEDVIRLRSNAVTPEYVRGLGVRKGWRPTVEEVVRFKSNGLEASYVGALAPHFDPESIIRLHNNAVSAGDVREFRALGYSSAEDLIRLRNNDVTPAFARRAQNLHGRVTTEELIQLRVNGVE